VKIQVFEGERPMTQHNHRLGEFNLTGIPPAPRGTPQIEVTFDVDANGILNVSAVEKAGGRSEKITITNDNGRLSKEEIDRLLEESEKFKADDEKQKERIDAKNGLESYCFNIKSTIEDSNIKDKIPESERKMITDTCNDAIAWLENNQMAEVEEFKDKQKELETTFNPIMKNLYGNNQQSGAGSCGAQDNKGFGAQTNGGPTIEEVD
jgi:L1 cell adhesion molecule like protein